MTTERDDAKTIVNGDKVINQERVAVVIATHKYCYPLEQCISSHLKLLESDADLIFVDNGSGGEMTRWAREKFSEITVITREINGYFCGGYNSGMQYAIDNGYDFVLIVNADTAVFNDGYISSLIEAARNHKNAAFLGPTVFLREDGNIQNTILRYPWFGRYLRHWLTAPFKTENRSANATEITPVDFLNGVCVLCRVEALKEVGLLDEAMGGYVEDTDWSWRARQLGWTSQYVPVPSIIHHQPADEYEHHSVKTFMLRRNHVYWHMKAGQKRQAWLFAAFSLMLARFRAAQAILRRHDSEEHRRYVAKFKDVVKRILSNEPMGEWFGPPAGQL